MTNVENLFKDPGIELMKNAHLSEASFSKNEEIIEYTKKHFRSIIITYRVIGLRVRIKKLVASDLLFRILIQDRDKLKYFKVHKSNSFFFFYPETQEYIKCFEDVFNKLIKASGFYLVEFSRTHTKNSDRDPVLNQVNYIKIETRYILDNFEPDYSSCDGLDTNETQKRFELKTLRVDSELLQDLRRDPKVWSKFDHDFLDESTGEYYYDPSNSLECRGALYKIDPKILEDIISTLVFLYTKGKEFKKFPKSSIMVSVHNSIIVSFKLAFNIFKIPDTRSGGLDVNKYQKKMHHDLIYLIAGLLTSKTPKLK
jgi:hypothetical protein